MSKKIILITLFILFAGALIAGGISRTSAKSGYDISLGGEQIVEITQNPNSQTPRALGAGEGQQNGERAGQSSGNGGQGQGRSRQEEEALPDQESNGQGRGGQGKEYDSSGGQGQDQQGQGYGRNGGGQGQAQGQGQGQGFGRGQQQYAEQHDLVLIEGIVTQDPAAGVDMILDTEGGQLLVGTGPGYLQEQGFALAVGDTVQVSGFYENEEFKAVTITRLSDGQAITLRDEFGRPMWSGAGRRAQGI